MNGAPAKPRTGIPRGASSALTILIASSVYVIVSPAGGVASRSTAFVERIGLSMTGPRPGSKRSSKPIVWSGGSRSE